MAVVHITHGRCIDGGPIVTNRALDTIVAFK